MSQLKTSVNTTQSHNSKIITSYIIPNQTKTSVRDISIMELQCVLLFRGILFAITKIVLFPSLNDHPSLVLTRAGHKSSLYLISIVLWAICVILKNDNYVSPLPGALSGTD